MQKSLRAILTKSGGGDDGPLFKSAADLADAIANNETTAFKNPQTIATLLSNVFLRRRACSHELSNAIKEAARARLRNAPADKATAFIASLDHAIETTNAAIARQAPRKPGAVDLSRTTEPSDISVDRALDLFRYVGDHAGLVCCEYRDYPRAHSEGKYSKLGIVAAQGVANGGFFAMFIPFPDMEKAGRGCRHTGAVRDYIQDLRRFARDAHYSILAAAIRYKRAEESEYDLAQRIVRYERGVPREFDCPAILSTGIQSRLFYVQIPLGPQVDLQEVWEWVAADDEKDDFFIQRRDSSIPKQVARDQFFPVVKEWITHKHLLATSSKVSDAIKRWNSDADADLPTNFWVVPEPPEVALKQAKEKFLKQ
jgi:hypothetical protein